MKAYRTYLTIKDPKQVVLSDVPFRPGQQVEIVVLAADEDNLARVRELKDLLRATQSLPQAQALTEDDIMREVEVYRSGQ
ncbi:MAG: hypothetical protein AUG51_02060 [Acidobacteria bacterium 13_1_20CM_3_53_8]|nr:MAG: hypothetical protein AUG51_02060 [Acidobacteria bacterium 13_1_20CM_3_53_8]